jgi:TatD DNase family protein
MKYFDIHSHLNLSPLLEQKESIIETLTEKHVGTITVGVDLNSSKSAVEIANGNNLFASVGFHPTEVTEQDFVLEKFKELSMSDKVVAIGECGLDYFRIESDDLATKEKQKEVFMTQIDLSIERGLPLILHIRPQKGTMDAYEDALEILEKKSGARGDVHFFVGSMSIAKRFLNLGFYLSFTGVITFTRDYDEVIKMIPIENILTETDAPFVTPVPYRGKTCEPWMVEEVVKKIAEIKDLDVEETRLQILENAKKLFGV